MASILLLNFLLTSFELLGVMALLRPLLLDNVPSIQQSAALALGRLANYSDELAEAVVSNEILPQLVYSLSEQNVSIRLLEKELIWFKSQ
jgi:HEAT repeat protein